MLLLVHAQVIADVAQRRQLVVQLDLGHLDILAKLAHLQLLHRTACPLRHRANRQQPALPVQQLCRVQECGTALLVDDLCRRYSAFLGLTTVFLRFLGFQLRYPYRNLIVGQQLARSHVYGLRFPVPRPRIGLPIGLAAVVRLHVHPTELFSLLG